MVFEHGRNRTAWNSQSCNLESLCSPVRCDQKGSLRDQRGSNGTGMSFPNNGRYPVLWVQPFITAGMDHDGFRYMFKKINYIKLNDLWPSSPVSVETGSRNRKSHCAGYLSLVPKGEVWLPSGNPLKKPYEHFKVLFTSRTRRCMVI